MKTGEIITKKINYLLQNSKIQFFGINGKCCTESFYSNYVTEIFPISGNIEKNAFEVKQIGGKFFKRTMKNFMHNTEGGENLELSNFVKFIVDYGDSARKVIDKTFTIGVIYLWNSPDDIAKVKF